MDQSTQQPTSPVPPPQIAPAPQAAATPSPISQSPPPAAGQPKKGSHKGIFIVVGIILVIALFSGAAYLLLQNESTTEVSQVQIQSTTPRYKTPTPTTTQVEGTVEEVEAVMVDDSTGDVTEIQVEVDQL